MSDRDSPQVRPARPEDIAAIHAMIGELAEFEHLQDQFVAGIDDLHASLFGESPAAEALVAEAADGLAGYAIYFTTFSTFLCRSGLWLEDLYVRPAWRGSGVGKRLLLAVAREAKARGSGRFEWSVLDWNQRAIDFYEAMGGEILEEWRVVRVNRGGIERLAPSE